MARRARPAGRGGAGPPAGEHGAGDGAAGRGAGPRRRPARVRVAVRRGRERGGAGGGGRRPPRPPRRSWRGCAPPSAATTRSSASCSHRSARRASAAARALRERGLRGPVHVLAGDAAVPPAPADHRAAARRALLAGGDAELAGADRRAAPVGVSGAARAARGRARGARRRRETAPRSRRAARPRARRWDRLGAYQLLAPLAGAPLPGRAAAAARAPRRRAARRHARGLPRPRRRRRGAAAALFIHRTSLYHRLRRIEAITGRACATATTACCCTWGCGSGACGDYARSVREPGLLSVVAPMHDEEDTVDAFHARTVAALGGLEFELIARRRRLARRHRRAAARARGGRRAHQGDRAVAQLRPPGGDQRRARARPRRRRGDDRRRPAGPAGADRRDARGLAARRRRRLRRARVARGGDALQARHRALVLPRVRQARADRARARLRRLPADGPRAARRAARRCPSATASCAG